MAIRRVSSAVLVGVLLLFVGLGVSAVAGDQQTDVTVHEWGTFTTVAAPDGQALQWTPLGGPTDLPCFVEHYKNGDYKVLLSTDNPLYDYETARRSLPGKVRMETPVLYFYADRATRLDISVGFDRGLFTEWYPKAVVSQPAAFKNALSNPQFRASMRWSGVDVLPGTSPTLPREKTSSHYYAARAVDAAPIRVNGQDEAFLFYRGVGGFDVPISTTLREDGSVVVKNTGAQALQGVILFTSRDGKIGYRVQGAVESEATLAAPTLDGTFDGLRRELEKTLTARGLFAKEAAAMVETWRDSWFEEGTRVFYILPVPAVDAILPLAINPAPKTVARVFVGRSELITP
ncbi:MAG TPA: hypothetical protein VFV98_09310, partial [Vicinamibacterales bacterium]|nr:hypothetical protein [Vicinamibacterales bacterium]